MSETKTRPILFSAPMVRALLNGKKTQTRRIINPNPEKDGHYKEWTSQRTDRWLEFCPYGGAGNRLWVRETWCNKADENGHAVEDSAYYLADGKPVQAKDEDGMIAYCKDGKEASPWRPSIFMPRWASRLTLEITDVRVERVQSISWVDAVAEGVREHIYPACGDHPDLVGYVTDADGEYGAAHVTPQEAYAKLWDSINGKDVTKAWNANPWVWCITFKRI